MNNNKDIKKEITTDSELIIRIGEYKYNSSDRCTDLFINYKEVNINNEKIRDIISKFVNRVITVDYTFIPNGENSYDYSKKKYILNDRKIQTAFTFEVEYLNSGDVPAGKELHEATVDYWTNKVVEYIKEDLGNIKDFKIDYKKYTNK